MFNLSKLWGSLHSESKIYKQSSSTTVSGTSYQYYLYMGGSGSSAPGNGNLRYFTTGPITGLGKLSVVYASTAAGTCYIYDNNTSTSTDGAIATLTPSTNSKVTSSIINLGSTGKNLTICHSSKCCIYAIIWEAITKPVITTQPVGANYITGDPIAALTVAATASAGELSYQWYSCDDALKTNAVEIGGATSSSYTPSVTGFYFCRVSDSNGNTDTNVVEITISAAAAPSFTSITPSTTSVVKGTASTITAVVEGNPAPTIQWYSNMVNNNTSGTEIDGATNLTLNLANTSIGTYYYYAVASNSEGDATSDVVAITVNGSSACELTNIKFSNGAYGAINADNLTITVPYLAGTSEPTVTESSLVISTGATYVLAGNTLTVTAEDGTTNKEFVITKTAFTPLAVSGNIAETTFAAVPAWICNPYGYDANKGVKFAKKVDEASNMRVAKGNTRQYYFISAAKTLTLTSGTGENRAIKVYRNGVELNAPTATAAKNSSIEIALDQNAPCMIMIESNQTGGDGGFTKYAITASTSISITPAKEYTTLTSAYPLNFTDVSGLKAYIATEVSAGNVQMTQVNKVPAGTGLVLKATTPGSAVEVPVFDGAGADDVSLNKMQGSAVETTAVEEDGGYILKDGVFQPATVGSLPVGKAYLNIAVSAPVLMLNFGDVTGISTTLNNKEKIINNVYDLQGRKIAQPTKGLYIVNGRKVIK